MTDVLRYAENVTCPDIRPIIAQASYDYGADPTTDQHRGRTTTTSGCACAWSTV
jgi:hypothetical protein